MSTDWINNRTLKAKFTMNPRVFEQALSTVQNGVKNQTEVCYLGVSKDKDSELYDEMMMSPEPGNGRLVLGSQGEAGNNAFEDVPVFEVGQEGEFLFNQPEKLTNWASQCTEKIEVEYHCNGGMKRCLICRHGEGEVPFTIRMAHSDDNFEQLFPSLNQRFDHSEVQYSEPKELYEMISRADSHAPSGSSGTRTGDLIFEDGDVEFVTLRKEERHSVATLQRAKIDIALQNFEWEISDDHLSILKSAFGEDNVEIGLEEKRGRYLFKIAFQKEIGDDRVYSHRQLFVERQQDPLKDWVDEDDSELFESPGCQLFATIVRDKFVSAMGRIWALHPATQIDIQHISNSEGPHKVGLCRNEEEGVNDKIRCTIGDAEMDSFSMNESTLSVMETITKDHRLFQILTYPIADEPIPNGYIIVPLTDDDDPTVKKQNPDKYMTVTWEADAQA